jgi:hypothetical protein
VAEGSGLLLRIMRTALRAAATEFDAMRLFLGHHRQVLTGGLDEQHVTVAWQPVLV